jgi:phosphoribosylamine--glycine ligase
MVADGYPGAYRKGDPIHGLETVNAADVKVFHAGTRSDYGQVVTAGGRVLCVTALGKSVGDAGERAYAAVEQIHWQGAGCRRDIGYRAMAREKNPTA